MRLIRSYRRHMSRRIKLLIVFAVVVVGGYVAANFISGSGGGVSEDFSDARLKGALIAQEIVALSGKSKADLDQINEFSSQGKFLDALDLTSQVLSQSQGIRERASALANEIERMTRALSSVRSAEARRIALESISDRLVLIGRLINYSANLGQLADTLRNRLTGTSSLAEILRLVDQINAEVEAVNGLNEKSNATMERFDALVK